MDKNNKSPADKSIKLNISPEKINIPFIKSKKAQKITNQINTSIPKIIIRNRKADKISINPKIFTITIN